MESKLCQTNWEKKDPLKVHKVVRYWRAKMESKSWQTNWEEKDPLKAHKVVHPIELWKCIIPQSSLECNILLVMFKLS
jgi:hypothetical protein